MRHFYRQKGINIYGPSDYVSAPTATNDYPTAPARREGRRRNPLIYTDPSGEWGVIDSWVIGFFKGFFSTGKGKFKAGWKTANKMAGNDAKIWGGLFVTDPNKTFGGKVWEIFSRFTWQAPQTTLGWTTSQFTNTFFKVNWVKYKYGATVLQSNVPWVGFTLGSYINGDLTIEAEASNRLFQHEYGHYLQSQASGLFYLQRYAIPSALSKNTFDHPHDYHPVEQDANIRAFAYFSKNVKGFNYYENNVLKSLWKKYYNPILGYDWTSLPNSEQNQYILINNKVKIAWYDYVLGPNILINGIINTIILNSKY